MTIIRRNYSEIAPAIGPYSRGVKFGEFLFISGCTAVGTKHENGDIIQQTDVILNRIQQILQYEGLTMKNIIKVGVFIKDMNGFRHRQSEYNKLIEAYFEGFYPASTLLGGVELVLPSMLIEIEAIASAYPCRVQDACSENPR